MKNILKTILKSQVGSTLTMALMGLGAVGATGVYLLKQAQDAKKVVNSVESTSNEAFFESMVTVYLANSDTCTGSMLAAGVPNIDTNVTTTFTGISRLVDRDGVVLVEEGQTYNSGSIEVIDMRLEAPVNTVEGNGDFIVEYNRKKGSLGAQTLSRRFPLKIHFDGDTSTSYCYMDPTNDITAIINQELLRACNGNGNIRTNADPANPVEVSALFCEFVKHNYTDIFNGGTVVNCPAGQALRIEGYDTATRELRYQCEAPYTNQVMMRGCTQGLRYNSGSNSWECFNLGDIIDSTPTGTVGSGANCNIVESNNKVRIQC